MQGSAMQCLACQEMSRSDRLLHCRQLDFSRGACWWLGPMSHCLSDPAVGALCDRLLHHRGQQQDFAAATLAAGPH